MSMKLLTLREQQLLQLDILKEIHRVCAENNINYFMMYGTLIGAARHEGFIPWDDDIDLVMLRSEYDRFTKVCEDGALQSKYVIQNCNTDPEFEFTISRIGMIGTYSDDHSRKNLKSMNYTYVDVFPLDNTPDSPKERKKHAKRIRCWQRILHFRMNYQYDNNSKLKLVLKKCLAIPFQCIPLSWYMKHFSKEVTRYNEIETNKCGMLCGRYGYERESYDKADFISPILLKFEDGCFMAPKKYDEILKHIYGDYMALPPEKDRIIRHRVYLVEENQ